MVAPGTSIGSYSTDGRMLAFIEQPAGRPRQLFVRRMNLDPDGQRLAVAAAPEVAAGPARDSVVVVFNFLDDLKRRVPASE